MAVNTTEVNLPTKLSVNRVLLGTLQLFVDWTKGKRVEAVADLSQTISNPPTQAEVQAISDKMDELLAALRTDNSNILDS